MESCDWSGISVTVGRKHIELGLKMTAVSNLGQAEPIRISLALTVFEIFAFLCWRRENFQFSADNFVLIGRNGDLSSGFFS